MDDVEAARAKGDVERLDVDHELVADLRPPDQAHVGDRRAQGEALAGELDHELLLGRGGARVLHLAHDRAAELQHRGCKLSRGRGGVCGA